MEFSDFLADYYSDIAIRSLSQSVPGLDYDDVVSEMTTCLWRAWKTHDPAKGSFGPYWWSLWLNRRTDLTAKAYRLKRPRLVLVDEPVIEKSYGHDLFPDAPKGVSGTAEDVWRLIALGEQPAEIVSRLGITKRRYYGLIHAWKTTKVRTMLLG